MRVPYLAIKRLARWPFVPAIGSQHRQAVSKTTNDDRTMKVRRI